MLKNSNCWCQQSFIFFSLRLFSIFQFFFFWKFFLFCVVNEHFIRKKPFRMLNIKRRCRFNLTKNHDLSSNNNNNNDIVKGLSENEQKFCLQHNNCNCSTPEVCFIGLFPNLVHFSHFILNIIKKKIYRVGVYFIFEPQKMY